MTRPAEITLEEVAKACEQIRSLNQRPTVDRVRAIVNKGGRTTINKLLRQHLKAEQDQATPIDFELPTQAMVKFKEAVGLVTKDRDDQIKEIQNQLGEKDDYIQEILKESEELNKECESRGTQNSALREKLDQVNQRLSEREESVTQLEKQVKELSKSKEELIAQKSRNDTIAEQIKEYQERIKQLEGDKEKLLERALLAENERG